MVFYLIGKIVKIAYDIFKAMHGKQVDYMLHYRFIDNGSHGF